MPGRVLGALDERSALEDIAHRVDADAELSGGGDTGHAVLVDGLADVVVAAAGSEASDGSALDAAAPAGFQGVVFASPVSVGRALGRARLGVDAGVESGRT